MALPKPDFDSDNERPLSRIARARMFIADMRPSDRLIFYVLVAGVGIALLQTVYALERRYLIEVPSYGGSLVGGVIGAPRFVNPLLAISDADKDLTVLTYAGLMGYDEFGELAPVLAERVDISPDGKVYTFTLRPGTKFSDGTPLTSEDVVYTIEKAQDPSLKSPEFQNWSHISVQALDVMTVQFTLAKPYTPFLQDATLGILPSSLWKNVSDEEFPFSPYMLRPVGAGPFAVESITQNDTGGVTAYALKANSNYPLGRPYLDTFHFLFFEDLSGLREALDSGKIEAAYGTIGAYTISSPYSRIFGVFFNSLTEPLFARDEVRKALSLAIDRDAIVRDILGGYGTASMGPVPAGFGIDEVVLPLSTNRLTDARKVLTTGGWAFSTSTNTWTKKDKKETITLSLTLKTGNVPELKAIANAIQKNWEELGVPTTIELYSGTELTQTVIRPRKYGALLFGEVIGASPDLFAFWSSTERSDPGLNISNYNNKTVDALLSKIRTQVNGSDEQMETLTEINQRISADYPAAFTHTPDFVYTVPNDVQGIVLSHISSPSDRFHTVAHWYRRTEFVWPIFIKK